MSLCSAQSASTGFVGSLTRFVDCQAQGFAASAYGALATPGSTLSIVLTGFITILIALVGYNLMLGHAPSLRSGIATLAKVAMVVALATSWPAYSTLVYNVVVEGPDQLVAELGRPAAVPGSDGTLTAHVDAVDTTLVRLTVLGPGQVTFERQSANGGLPPFVGFDAFALGSARIIFLLTAAGGLIAVRVVAALMLAVGPLFIAFLIFANTRSLFEGWVRVLAGAAIGSVAVSLILGVQLTLLEPWLTDLVARRSAGEPMVGMPAELMVATTLFAIILIAAIAASARLAGAFRLAPPSLVAAAESLFVRRSSQSSTSSLVMGSRAAQERTRADNVAESLTMLQRHERALGASGTAAGLRSGSGARLSATEARSMVNPASAGGRKASGGRRTGARSSASSARRDAQ